ncbi:Rieske 2Fe-2S domain-containing protein [Parasphingopyxis marina]|uniref:Aromatic ring-hydroxylating dioxygenase subunit alpha n=1 Tax=Parasphingopyxis marina TaxID=2761622 RepID=A0A842I2G1_9SPHN|nr:Rieske 2Fe-2S domain-containing protein [Parasphingopyxis marina]MBC2778923.1 aromatic ring-hydroxylating dioxygenase subunit alpha [Parasphingopyxis marina]
MLRAEENERVTRTGPGTPLGEVMRRYWVPALLSAELPEPDCPPVRVGLLGEQLIAFRDSEGRVGLLDQRCPHRGASLFFGRNEECGIRCIFHGWKFDVDGNCTDLPNEPDDSKMKDKVKATAYPTAEAGGVVWAYLGPKEKMPPLEKQEWMTLPEGHFYCTKNQADANWLQMLEGGFDSSHSSFLHRQLKWAEGEAGTKTQVFRARSTAPRHEVDANDYGCSYASLRALPDGEDNYVRVTQFVMPFHQLRPFEGKYERPLISGHIWVPIDDTHCWVYSWMQAKDGGPLDREFIEAEERDAGRSPEFFIPGTFRFKQNKDNDYLIDREAQRTESFTGITGISTQDQAAQESMGPIADRTFEHLGTADLAIVRIRQLLLKACRDLEEGSDPLGSQAALVPVRPAEKVVPKDEDWRSALAGDLEMPGTEKAGELAAAK